MHHHTPLQWDVRDAIAQASALDLQLKDYEGDDPYERMVKLKIQMRVQICRYAPGFTADWLDRQTSSHIRMIHAELFEHMKEAGPDMR